MTKGYEAGLAKLVAEIAKKNNNNFTDYINASFESSIFAAIAFSHLYDFASLADMVMLIVLIKVGYELISSPITLYIIKLLKKAEGYDHYDYNTKFSFLPFAK